MKYRGSRGYEKPENPAMRQADFPAPRVVKLCRELQALGVDIWIDGGWGVDALLGAQTRAHSDLDVVIEERDLPAMRSLLEEQGFADEPRDDTRPWNFVLVDRNGLRIDVHVIVRDAFGNGIYGPPHNGQFYPADALLARGTIEGTCVHCLSPDHHVSNRLGHAPRETDYHDMSRLTEKFGIELPDGYRTPARPGAGRRERSGES